jgi:hypothetical protein
MKYILLHFSRGGLDDVFSFLRLNSFAQELSLCRDVLETEDFTYDCSQGPLPTESD